MTAPSCGRRAARYAARFNWPVFPLHTPTADGGCSCAGGGTCRKGETHAGKHPRTPRGFHDSTIDAGAIAAWWAKWPHANVGIATGASSGLLVIDVDPRHDGDATLAALEALLGPLPIAPEVATGDRTTDRIGRHLYFRHPGGATIAELGTGVEVKGDGGYVVGPPSMHRSGERYRWRAGFEPHTIPLPDLPSAWAAFIRKSEGRVTEQAEQDRADGATQSKQRQTEAVLQSSPLKSEFTLETTRLAAAAIDRTMPTAPGTRNRRIFNLARALRAIPECAGAPLSALRGFVVEWHRRAKSVATTQDFETTWADFIVAWGRVRLAEGEGPMGKAMERARSTPIPAGALIYDRAEVRLLASLCRELQREAGADPFFLSARTAGTAIGTDTMTAFRWLTMLRADGLIAEVEKGGRAHNPRRATRWRWIGEAG